VEDEAVARGEVKLWTELEDSLLVMSDLPSETKEGVGERVGERMGDISLGLRSGLMVGVCDRGPYGEDPAYVDSRKNGNS
jgi:hypothetical protein